MSKLRKIFTVSVMAMTIISLSVVAAPQADAAASAGDLIKMNGLASVYYLASDGKRYVFPNESTYFSWYRDFSSVVTISQSELESYPLGANVTIRPGTKLVKITTNPKVYAVESDGSLVWVPDEATAKTLYGDSWAKRVSDVPDSFWNNYTESSGQVSATVYPEGSLVKFGTAADVYYIDGNGDARKIADEAAFLANRFNWDDVITATIDMPSTASDITGSEAGLIDTASGAGGTPVSGGSGLSVALASDTPEAKNIPAASPNEFLKINLTASNDGAVKVSAITLKAYELGTVTYIDSVTFYDNGVKVGTAKNINSDGVATFNFSTPIEIAAGATKSLIVKANIQTGQTGNFALGINSASDVVTSGGAAVSGSFPVKGNTMTAVSGVTIGAITLTSTDTAVTTNNFGEDNVALGGFDLTAANEAIIWESMRLKNGGNNTAGIVTNMKVLIDGDEVVTGAELNDKYVDFNMGNYLIAKNDTITVEIYGDIGISTAGQTIDLFIDTITDLAFVGQNFGYGVQIDATGFATLDAASEGVVVTLAAGDVTIDMDKAATPSKDVRPGDNDVVLATFSILSSGENATITGITDAGSDEFYVTGTSLDCGESDNWEMRDTATGAIYDLAIASSTDTTKCKLTLSDEISLVKGVKKTYEIRADLNGPNATKPMDADDTLQIVVEDGGFSITGDDSDDNLNDNISPTSVSSSIATVKTASLTWSTTVLTNKTVVGGAKDVVIYSAAVEAGESSAITVTSVKISGSNTNPSGFDDANISALRLYFDGKLVKTSSGNITEGVAAATDPSITFTSLDTVNRVIPAGKGIVVEVKADFVSSFAAADNFRMEVNSGTDDIVARDADGTNVLESVANTGTASRVVTMATVGTLKVDLKVDDPKANNDTFILAGTETRADNYLAELVFTTANEAIKIKTVVLEQQGSATAQDIALVHLYDDSGAKISSKVPSTNGHANFDDLNIVLPADQATSWFIGVTTKTINGENDNYGTASYGREVIYSLASTTGLAAWSLAEHKAVTAVGNESGSDITIVSSPTSAVGAYSASTTASKRATTTGSRLVSITNDMTDGTISVANDKIIGKYKFVFDNGINRDTSNDPVKAELTQLIITMASSTGVDVTNVQAYLSTNSFDLTDAVQPVAGVATITLTDLDDTNDFVDGEVIIIIEGDITTTGSATNQSLTTSIANLRSDFTYNGYSNLSSTDWTDVTADLSMVSVSGGTLRN